MSSDQLVPLIGVGVLAIGAVCVGLAVAWFAGRRYAEATSDGGAAARAASDRQEPDASSTPEDELTAPRRQVRDRAIRVVALVFLASVAALTALSGRWHGPGSQETEGAIYLLVAGGTLSVVFLQDMLPTSLAPGLRGWLEAGAAIAFLTVLVGLSDGLLSPFTVGFFLLVGSASLARDGWAPLVLALVAGLCYGAIGLLVGVGRPVTTDALALIVFVTVALLLLAYVCTVAGREQRRAREAALRLARFDPLTGLYNRAHFFATMERELRLAERAGRAFGVLMLDLDGLKPVNDTFGHPYGDRLLQGVTEVIQRTVRTTDTPARYGGDEFVILLPDTDAAGAYVVAEKLRHDIGSLSIRVSDRNIRTSVSIGLVAYPEDGTNVDELMSGADSALYEAKRSGKDRIVGYTTRTERVATRMGTDAQRRPGGGASGGIGTASAATGAGGRPSVTIHPERAPWETGTTQARTSGARRTARVHVGTDPATPSAATPGATTPGATRVAGPGDTPGGPV